MAEHDRQTGGEVTSSQTMTAVVSGIPGTPSLPIAAAPLPITLGRYVVIEEVGRGGMGRVLRAYDPKLQREVALKVLRTTAISEEARGRLVREARAMAKLSHANVVAVYDVEDTGSGVMLVMEYIAGSTLRDWLDDQRPAWPTIVARYVEAGRGLAAAHRSELLHRDFKPSNVLIGDADAIVKVTDFGLAKLASTESDDAPEATTSDKPARSGAHDELTAELTETGTVMGTPRYMAPEQHRGERLGPATDQYAFCVALWEALVGSAPFSPPDLAVRKHAGPPPWPGVPGVPRGIGEALRRGLAVQPSARFVDMDALLAELVVDPTRGRRWALALVGAAVVLALGGLATHSLVDARLQQCTGARSQLTGAWDPERRAAIEAAFADSGAPFAPAAWAWLAPELDGYAEQWIATHEDACAATTIRGEQSSELLDLRMTCLRRARLALQATTDVLVLADAELVERTDRVLAELPPLAMCSDPDRLRAELAPPSAADAAGVERIRGELATAAVAGAAARYAQCEEAIARAEAELARVDYPPLLTELLLARAQLRERLSDFAGTEASYRDALANAAREQQWRELGTIATHLMHLLGARLKRPDDALRYRELAFGLAQRFGDRALADYRNALGNVLETKGEYAAAQSEYEAALALVEDAPANARELSMLRNNLAGVLEAQGDYVGGEAQQRLALAIDLETLGPLHPHSALSRANLANFLAAQGKHAEAAGEYRAALAAWASTLPADHVDVASTRMNLALSLVAQLEYDAAAVEYRAAIPILERALGADHPDVATAHANFGIVLAGLGEYAEAEAEDRAALAVAERALGPDHPAVAVTRSSLAWVLLARGKPDESLPLARAALATMRSVGTPREHQAETTFVVARALWDSGGDRSEARALAHQAAAEFATAGTAFAEARGEIEKWLGTHPGP